MPPAARLLDLTRLVSRTVRVLTGVDRVELAYAEALSAGDLPVFGLVRTRIGYVLTGRAGVAALAAAARGGGAGPADRVSRLLRRGDAARAAAESLVRRHALARCLHAGLPRMLSRRLPPGSAYLNVGQTTLRGDVIAAVRRLKGSRIAVMIHDTIPLDHPDWQREGTVPAFARRLALARQADIILTNSQVVAEDVTRHLAPGPVPRLLPAALGVTLTPPDSARLPPDLPPPGPWFVTLGTIEPRKNHALLLDLWDRLGPEAPWLIVAGSRGWRNEAVFARLDRGHPRIIERAGLDDGAVAALVQGARALLFPSLAEGFGLPVIEAAARGTPVVCGDLAIWRELLGDWPVYQCGNDPYQWQDTVLRLASDPPLRCPAFDAPGWSAHFKIVLNAT